MATKPKRGRPSLTGKAGETPRVELRVAPSELSAWKRAAKADGCATLSAWLRMLAAERIKKG